MLLGSCQDNDTGCDKWAKHDMCTTNARYMLVNCKKSCKACGGKAKDICIYLYFIKCLLG